jgi:hypothetical protein
VFEGVFGGRVSMVGDGYDERMDISEFLFASIFTFHSRSIFSYVPQSSNVVRGTTAFGISCAFAG